MPKLIAFLQRYIGYCLTGDVSEHVFVFAYGTGANGKSTFIGTIQKIFGDYATVADMATFLASNNDRHPTELAKLHGARLVIATETASGSRLGRGQNQGHHRRRKADGAFYASGFFRFRSHF